MNKKSLSVSVGGKKICFETGLIGKQANSSVLARCGETIVFSSVCSSQSNNFEQTFLSVRVDYQEKFSSIGRTVGGFSKREARASEKEILIARLIDRPLRPMFEVGFYDDVQISSFVWSYDKENLPDVIAICASSAALACSSIPFKQPVGAVRVTISPKNQILINADHKDVDDAILNFVVAGTKDKILMIEGHSDFATKNQVLSALEKAHKEIINICDCIADFAELVNKSKDDPAHLSSDEDVSTIETLIGEDISKALKIKDKKLREVSIKQVFTSLYENVDFSHIHRGMLNDIISAIISRLLYKQIQETKERPDGRSVDDIRDIDIITSLLPRSHGSVLFTRGETQALAVCTLGGENMSQKFESLDGEGTQRFYLHYFFPGFSVGEVSKLGAPGRRELGHGKLAERSLESIIPSKDKFPYSIRIESTITESNGSSSMASVCGGCLSLMDAGVPIKSIVAGVAMGMIGSSNDDPIILTDICGTEDAFGDADFKLAGNEDGITGIQMDLKVDGLTMEHLKMLIDKSIESICKILSVMGSIVPNKKISKHAPKIVSINVKPSKIPLVIGSNGRTIKQICEKTNAEININQATSTIYISASSDQSIKDARDMIEDLTAEVSIGNIYDGKVKNVAAFGVFVEISPGTEGLCHISEMAKKVPHGQPIPMRSGESMRVKVLDINEKGQIKLTQRI